MEKKLGLSSVIRSGEHKGKRVADIINAKKDMFDMIRQGYQFDDETLSKAGIKKTISSVRIEQVVTEHEKDSKVYQKDTVHVSKIIKELLTIDNQYHNMTESEAESQKDNIDIYEQEK